MRRQRDSLNVPLEDTDLLDELELLSRFIVAANQCQGRLVEQTIDSLLSEPPRTEPRCVQW